MLLQLFTIKSPSNMGTLLIQLAINSTGYFFVRQIPADSTIDATLLSASFSQQRQMKTVYLVRLEHPVYNRERQGILLCGDVALFNCSSVVFSSPDNLCTWRRSLSSSPALYCSLSLSSPLSLSRPLQVCCFHRSVDSWQYAFSRCEKSAPEERKRAKEQEKGREGRDDRPAYS